MQPRRPTSLTVIAVFHFVLGGLGLLCGMTALAGQAAGGAGRNPFGPPPGGGNEQQKELEDFQKKVAQRAEQEAPLQKPVSFVVLTVNLLLSVLMIVAGVGLIQVRPYGWKGSVFYGVVSLATQVFVLLFSLIYTLPISQRILDEELRNHPALGPIAGFMRLVGPLTIGVALLGMIYPAIVLIVMSRPAVRAAFRGDRGAPDDYGDRFEPGGRAPDAGEYPPGYGQEPPPGYGYEPDDRIGPAPR
jgi:hypothetical protein